MSSINKIKTNDITYDVEDTSKQGLLIPGENITIENNVISAQNSYVLPVAGENTLGGVKVGENLSIDGLGKLSSKNFNIELKNVVGNIPAVVQSGDKYYKPSTNKIYTYIANAWDSGVEPSKGINYINLEDNRIYLYNGETLKLPVDPYTLPTASEIVLGGVKVGDNLSITQSGVLSATDTTYTAGDNITISSNNVISAPDSVGQLDVMPTASEDYLNKVVQFVGTTDSSYTSGYFYRCESDGETPPTYSWVAVEVQESSDAEEPIGSVYQTYGVSWVYPTATAHILMTKVINYFMKTGRIPTGVYQSTYGYNGRILQIAERAYENYATFTVVFDGCRRDPVEAYGQRYYQVLPEAIQCFISRVDYDNGVVTDVYSSSSLDNTRLNWSGAGGTIPNNLFVDNSAVKLIGKDNTISWTPAQDYGLVHKKYVDEKVIQVSTLPTADSTNLDRIYQYIGATDSNYINGYFYKCVSDGASPATYSWERIDVQPASGSDPGIPSYWIADNGNSYMKFKKNQKPTITNIINYKLSHNGNLPNGGFVISGVPKLYSITASVYSGYVELTFLFRGYVRRYNSDMGDGWYSVYDGAQFTVYADPTEYANGHLSTVYWTTSLDPNETGEKSWNYWSNAGFKVYNNTDLMKQNQVIFKATWEPQSRSDNQGQLYIYVGTGSSTFKYGHIYQATTNSGGSYVMEELKQATDACEILMYDGTSSSASITTVKKYYNNIKNGIPTVLLLVTDKYPSGSGSGTSATGKIIVPMSLDTTIPWSSTYRACLIGTAVSYDATDVYFAKQVLMFQDDTVTGMYTLQWLNKYYLELNDWFYRSGLSPYYSGQTYSVGDYVYYLNNIYVCNTAISTPEDFDSSKWTQINYLDYLSRRLIGSALGGSY